MLEDALHALPSPPAAWGEDPDQFDPALLRRAVDRLAPVFGPRGYFRTEVSGWEHLPQGPALFVSNHSGGTTIIDQWGFGCAWYRRLGTDRVLYALGHDMLFRSQPLARQIARIGGLRASRGAGMRVLTGWRRDLLVAPGGDREVWRPTRDRYRVRFHGRTGYARLALRAGVPVVPVANAGAHDGLFILSDGAPLARALRFPQLFRAEICPVHVSFPWGLTVGPWPHLPPPTQLRYRIGRPIYPDASLAPGAEPTPAQIRDHDERIRAGLQAELDVLADTERPFRERARDLGRTIGRVADRAVRPRRRLPASAD